MRIIYSLHYKKIKPLNGKKKAFGPPWGEKAAVFILSIKQHKTVLGKKIPIDHIPNLKYHLQ